MILSKRWCGASQLGLGSWVKTNGTIFWVGAPPILVCLSGELGCSLGYGLLTHGYIRFGQTYWPSMDSLGRI